MARNKPLVLMDVVRKELLQKKKTKECCKTAFLSGAFRVGLELRLNNESALFALENDSKTFIEYVAAILDTKYEIPVVIEELSRAIGKNSWTQYRIEVPIKGAGDMLFDCGILDDAGNFCWGIVPKVIEKKCDKRAYLQGVFLSCGYVNAPSAEADSKSGYQMEFKLNSDACKSEIKKLIGEVCLIEPEQVLERKDQPTLYVRSSEIISDILAGLKASKGVILLNQITAARAMKNTINRGTNVEVANIDKIYSAAGKQIAMIGYLKDNGYFESLTDKLQEVAELRLKYPRASLEEMASLLENCTKSALNHRFRKLAEIYEEVKDIKK